MKWILLLVLASRIFAADWLPAPKNYALTFPKDHGSHPAQKIEWWYFTGNLQSSDGHLFGYQLTFFRIGTDPQPTNPSAWTVRDLHMAHFAISDLSGGKYFHQQRLNRAGPGLCGADLERLAVWNGPWRAEMKDAGQITLQASDPVFEMNITLTVSQPPVLHGDQGYSRKGVTAGNASIYYSLTRLGSSGTLRIGGQKFEVTGQSWMDHEFGSSFLEPGQMGWDWFSLQLDDGSDLMLFQIRQALGAPAMSGTLVKPDGTVEVLTGDHFKLGHSDPWKSPATGAQYPLKWTISLPQHHLELKVSTPLSDQEMISPKAGPSYWEGAVVAEGVQNGQPIRGRGYLEMTGYSGAAMRSFFHLEE
jgi:predicted secreted hydrolase